jgi:hypothetical protein
MRRGGLRLCSVLGALLLCAPRSARAYRPFNGTDADVAKRGEFELELGPAQFYRRANANYVIAPATVLNLGFAEDLEAVVDFQDVIASRPEPGQPRVQLVDTDVLVKWVLRHGALQDASGMSLALEAGPLLPEFHGDDGFGAQANLIGSFLGDWGALHFNEQAGRGRLGGVAVFSGVIAEGPRSLAIRPVSELFFRRERTSGVTYSALVGAIWPAREALVVDTGLRVAREDGARALEVRLGLTWAFALWAR